MLVVILMRGPARYGVTALLAVLSPSVMLAFERGNNDLVIWSLVCCAAFLFVERHIIKLAAAYALLAFAVVLKLFPIFCSAIALRVTRSAIVVAIALAVSSIFYFYSIAHLFPIIRRNTDYTTVLSFGYIILFAIIEKYAAPRFGFDAAGLYHSEIPIVVLLSVLILAGACAFITWHRGSRLCRISEGTAGTAFLFGAGIFLGSFVFLGTNYAYRMTF